QGRSRRQADRVHEQERGDPDLRRRAGQTGQIPSVGRQLPEDPTTDDAEGLGYLVPLATLGCRQRGRDRRPGRSRSHPGCGRPRRGREEGFAEETASEVTARAEALGLAARHAAGFPTGSSFTGGSFWLSIAVTCSSGHDSTARMRSGIVECGFTGSYGGCWTVPPLPDSPAGCL